MSEYAEDERFALAGHRGNVVQFPPASGKRISEPVSFTRRELDQILRIYGNKVCEGQWRDYAIDMLKERAVFSVFRRASETPLYTIEKHPRLARRQGAFCIVGSHGQILKRGHELSHVLVFFAPKLAAV